MMLLKSLCFLMEMLSFSRVHKEIFYKNFLTLREASDRMRLLSALKQNLGAIAQLGERLHGMQEVSGSIPLSSTRIFLGPHRLEA
jgi:hypothetical protein